MNQLLKIGILLALTFESTLPKAGQMFDWKAASFLRYAEAVKRADKYTACNGSGDDQSGVQRALDEAAGTTLMFPSGHTCVNRGTSAWRIPAKTRVIWQDGSAKAVLAGGGANAALFEVGGDNVYIDNPQIFDSRAFNYKALSYGIISKGLRRGLTVKGGLCRGFSYACVGVQDGNQRVTIDGLTCRGIGSQDDGARHDEGRCVDILASSTPNVDITIKNLVISQVGKHGISSDSFGTAYAIERGVISHNVISLSGDTGIVCSDCEDVAITRNAASKGGQNGIDHLGQGITVCGHPSTPSKHITIVDNMTNDNGEAGLQIGPWANSIVADHNTALRNIVGGVKVGGSNVSDITVSNTTAAFNHYDGIVAMPAMTEHSDGVCTLASAIFTSPAGTFTGRDVGADIQLPGCGPSGSVLFATITAVNSNRSIRLNPSMGASAHGVVYHYGVFAKRISFLNNISHDNYGFGINCQATIDCEVSGGMTYNNGKTLKFRAGVVCQQSLRCRVARVNAFDTLKRSGTQAFGVRFYGSDHSSVNQIIGFGNSKALLALTDGGSSNSSSDGALRSPAVTSTSKDRTTQRH